MDEKEPNHDNELNQPLKWTDLGLGTENKQ